MRPLCARNPRTIGEAEVRAALEACEWDVNAAAARLDMNPATVRACMRKYKLPTKRQRQILEYFEKMRSRHDL